MSSFVLLRGLTREAAHWGDFGDRLAHALGPGHAVTALDLPGNGVLCTQASPATVQGMAAAARARVAANGPPAPHVLVAMSLGAMVALQWCHDAPEQVAGCVLINTSLRGHHPFWQRLRPAHYATLAGLLLSASPLRREQAVLAMTSRWPQRHDGVASQWARIARQRPVSRANALRQLWAAARYQPAGHRPEVPLLVLASQQDALVSPRCSQRLAQDWGLPLRLHPQAGHDLPLDDGAWVRDQILSWWRGLPVTELPPN